MSEIIFLDTLIQKDDMGNLTFDLYKKNQLTAIVYCFIAAIIEGQEKNHYRGPNLRDLKELSLIPHSSPDVYMSVKLSQRGNPESHLHKERD